MSIDFSGPVIKPMVDVVNPTARLEQLVAHLEKHLAETINENPTDDYFSPVLYDIHDLVNDWLKTWRPFLQSIAIERAYLEEMYYRNGGAAKEVADNWRVASRKEKEIHERNQG